MLPHKVSPGSIFVLYSKWNPFLRGGKAGSCLFYAKSHLFLLFTNCPLEQDGVISVVPSWSCFTFDPVPPLGRRAGPRERDTVRWILPRGADPGVNACHRVQIQSEKLSFCRDEPPPQEHKGIPRPVLFPQIPLFSENLLTRHYPAALWGGNLLFIQSAEDFYTNLRVLCPSGPTRTCAELSVGENNNLELGEWALWLCFHWPGLLIPGELCPNCVASILPPFSSNRFSCHQSQRAPGNF